MLFVGRNKTRTARPKMFLTSWSLHSPIHCTDIVVLSTHGVLESDRTDIAKNQTLENFQ